MKIDTMKHELRFFRLFNYVIVFLLAMPFLSCSPEKEQASILILSQPDETSKGQVPELTAIMKLAAAQNIIMQVSDQASLPADKLEQYHAVIFLGNMGAVLTREQQLAIEEYVGAGGGFMGLQAELGNPDVWPWYAAMYQAAGKSTIMQVSRRAPREEKGASADFFLNQEYAGGRVSLMGKPHQQADYRQPDFQNQFLSSLGFVLGTGLELNNGSGAAANADKRFTRRVLQKDVEDGVKLAIADNGVVYYIERAGKL